VAESADACGLRRVAMTPSPITGATGNREFLMHIRLAETGGNEKEVRAVRTQAGSSEYGPGL
jgi:hypothetical protein